MKVFAVFMSLFIIIAALALALPDLLINPGQLMKGHQQLKRNCLACHIPFQGVKALQCISCHRPETIGIRTVSGVPMRAATGKVNFHKGLAPASCVECHTEHKGREAGQAIRAFRHDALSLTLRNNCNACHSGQIPKDPLHLSVGGRCAECHDTGSWKSVLFNHGMLDAKLSSACQTCHRADKPADAIHRQLASGCAECHETKRWKPARFDHGKFVASGKQCVSCHSADRPLDEMHRATSAGCGSCHGTDRWKPAKFDHSRYFMLDGDHRVSCGTCHTDQANYKKYSCTNCHEHSPSRIAAEHREEGIYNYQNCVRCHRSGGEGGRERHGGREYGRDDDD